MPNPARPSARRSGPLPARLPARSARPGGRAPARPGARRAGLLLAAGLAAALAAGPAGAAPAVADAVADPVADPVADAVDPQASTITVTATRAPLSLLEAPVTVTVFDLREMRDAMVEDIRDLVRWEPGVSVRRQPARFGAALGATGRDGNAGFAIRGLDGNRVLLLVDGIRLPEAFAFGAQATGRDLVDLGLVKSVEIVRGATSALYGSDGLAGAVTFTTADPGDLMAAGATLALVGRAAFDSAERQWTGSAAVAAQAGRVSLLAGATVRRGHALSNQGEDDAPDATRTAPNPQDRRSEAFLGKFLFAPAAGHRIRATGEHFAGRTATEVLSGRAPVPNQPGSVIDLDADDRVRRSRASLDWTFTPAGGRLEELVLAGHWQAAEDRQFTAEDRLSLPDRTRRNTLETEVFGGVATARLKLATGPLAHRLTLGADWSRTRQEGVRDGTVPTPPDVFPSRAFPPTRLDLAGLFLADEIRLGRFILFPGLRFDHYRLDARPDALTPGMEVADSADGEVTPKLGLTIRLSDGVSLLASFARGFRAPSPSQVNQFFENPTSPFFAYRSLPNPALGPERSRTLEGGLRFDSGPVSGQLTAFAGRYRDFISQEVVGGTGTIAAPVLFQFVNLERVRIHGIEGRARVALGRGVVLNGAFAWAEGRSDDGTGTTVPLISIDPLELVGGIDWRRADGRAGLRLTGTAVMARERSETTGLCTPACLPSDQFGILDLTGFLELRPGVVLRAGIFNLTDATYVEWSSIRGLADTAGNRAVRDAFTAPGRNASVSLALAF